MKYLNQKPGHFWWTQNPRYFIYILREFSGVLIAIYVLGALIGYTGWLAYIGLFGAMIHTLTWLYVMPQLLPIKLTPLQQKVAYFALLAIWIALSYGILQIIGTK